MIAGSDGAVETVADFGDDKEAVARRWVLEIKLAQKETKHWLDRVKSINERYKDERYDTAGLPTQRARKLNILWSNVQTTMPALYNREPLIVAERRYSDSAPVARTAGRIIERVVQTDHALTNFDAEARKMVLDYLLAARGVLWVRYEEIMGPVPVPGFPDMTYEGFVEQHAPAMFVQAEDFLHSPARNWQEVRWVARRAYMTRTELVSRFGKEIGEEVPLDHIPKHADDHAKSTPEFEAFKKAAIWELWDKTTKEVLWLSMQYQGGPLDRKKDPLGLDEFFPCPRPAYGTVTNHSLVPVPDYDLYRDQAEQVDDLTARIALIVEAIRIAGAYAGEKKAEIEQLVESGVDNVLVPVEDFMGWAEKGGLKGLIDWMPTEANAKVLGLLFDARERVKKDMWEVTGLSDLFRGQTVASETATAQRLKGQFASLRIGDRQQEVRRLIRDVVRIQAEIVTEKFAPDIIKAMSGIEGAQGVPPETVDPAIKLLASDDLRNWTLNIETDDTQIRDPEAEKQSAIEFVTAFGGFLQNAVQMVQGAPMLTPLVGEMAKFLCQKFRVARPLEAAIDAMIPLLEAQANEQRGMQDQAQQQELQKGAMPEGGEAPPDPQMGQAEMVRAQAEAQTMQADTAMKSKEVGLKEAQTKADITFGMREQDRKDRESAFKSRMAAAQQSTQRQKTMADIGGNVTKLRLAQQATAAKVAQAQQRPGSTTKT